MTERCVIWGHGISAPEFDSPRLCFFHIPVGVEVQLSQIPANSITAQAGMYCSATSNMQKGYMLGPVPGGWPNQSRSWGSAPGDRDWRPPGNSAVPSMVGHLDVDGFWMLPSDAPGGAGTISVFGHRMYRAGAGSAVLALRPRRACLRGLLTVEASGASDAPGRWGECGALPPREAYDSDEDYGGGGPGKPPCLEESCKGLGSVSLKINNQHTHTRVSKEPRCLLGLPIRLG